MWQAIYKISSATFQQFVDLPNSIKLFIENQNII